jgi:protein-tyrosine phosphatase
MIDLHTHILFGVDDGAKSIDESMKILMKAESIGIHTIVLTPHVSLLRPLISPKHVIIERFEMLKRRAFEQGLKVNLFLGAEVDEHDHLVQTIKSGYTIHQSNYALVDFSMRKADVSEAIYDLRHSGFEVIIAHPERTKYLNFLDLYRLKHEGAFLQVSSKHLAGLGKRRANQMARKLLKENMIDVVASDAHDVHTMLSMKKAYAYVLRKKGKEVAEKLFVTNPAKILDSKVYRQ